MKRLILAAALMMGCEPSNGSGWLEIGDAWKKLRDQEHHRAMACEVREVKRSSGECHCFGDGHCSCTAEGETSGPVVPACNTVVGLGEYGCYDTENQVIRVRSRQEQGEVTYEMRKPYEGEPEAEFSQSEHPAEKAGV